jgi:hypothetical protein
MVAVLRWLKVALLAWAVLSLLGIATLATLGWWSHRAYQSRVAQADDTTSATMEVAFTLVGAGLDVPVERIERRYCSRADSPGVLKAQRAWVRPGAGHGRDRSGWIDGGRLPVHVVAALEAARSRMRGDGEDWLPAPAALANKGYRVFATVGYEGSVVDSFQLIVLQPQTGSLHLARASGLGAVEGEMMEGHDCQEPG